MLEKNNDTDQSPERINSQKPDLSKLRPVIFWDTNILSIDWMRQSNAVIQRVFQRGNQQEKNEIIRFYGPEKVNEVLAKNE